MLQLQCSQVWGLPVPDWLHEKLHRCGLFPGPGAQLPVPSLQQSHLMSNFSTIFFVRAYFLSPLKFELKGHYQEIFDFRFFQEASSFEPTIILFVPFLFLENLAKIFSQLKVRYRCQRHQWSHLSRDHNNRNDTGGKTCHRCKMKTAVKLQPDVVVNLQRGKQIYLYCYPTVSKQNRRKSSVLTFFLFTTGVVTLWWYNRMKRVPEEDDSLKNL